MRSRILWSVGVVLVVGVAALLWTRYAADPDYRDVRPPTPVAGGLADSTAPQRALALDEDLDAESLEEAPVAGDNVECEERFRRADRPAREEINAVLSDAVRQLRASGSRDYLLAAARIDRGLKQSDVETLLRELQSMDLHDPIALWALLSICESADADKCDFAALEDNIRRNHSGNSAFWMAVAGNHLSANNGEAALDAMRMVVGTPEYDSYLAEQYLSLDRALAATTNWSAAQRAIHSIEFVASSPPGVGGILKQCMKLDAAWDALCDQLADRLSDDADDIMARGFGTLLRVEMHEARHGSDGIAEMREQLQENAFTFMGDEEQLEQAINALLNDTTLMRMFLENLESYGEITAFERLLEDADRLKETEGYDRCNFETNPHLRL